MDIFKPHGYLETNGIKSYLFVLLYHMTSVGPNILEQEKNNTEKQWKTDLISDELTWLVSLWKALKSTKEQKKMLI